MVLVTTHVLPQLPRCPYGTTIHREHDIARLNAGLSRVAGGALDHQSIGDARLLALLLGQRPYIQSQGGVFALRDRLSAGFGLI